MIDVPGFGWAPFEPVVPSRAVSVSATTLTNGIITLDVDNSTGTFAINGTSGFGRLVDDGDLGDSYNYSPPAVNAAIDTPSSVEVRVEASGPIVGAISITSTLEIPTHIDETSQTRVGATTMSVTTHLELRADDPTVYVSTSYVNPARDHRLRVHLPLLEAATRSKGECAFAVVERGLEAEGRPDEFGLPTFPSRRFVQAGGLTVVHEGINEYELVDVRDGAAHELALTLLRATGMLSRLGMSLRPLPAGPLTPVDGLQMVGTPMTLNYALRLDDVDPYAMVDDVLAPLETVAAPGGGTRASTGSELEISGAQVSAVQRVEGQLEVRVFNPTASESTVHLPGKGGWLVDLRGQAIAPFEGSFVLRSQGIATARITHGA